MSLRAVIGNKRLMLYAIEHSPSLVIDCANIANPHLFSEFSEEKLSSVFVVEVELLYTLRTALRRAKKDMEEHGARTLAVTSFDYLFNYQDEQENKEIYAQAWEILQELGKEFDVVVGIKKEQTDSMKMCESIIDNNPALQAQPALRREISCAWHR